MNNISITIEEVCKELGIDYQSHYLKYGEHYSDAKKLVELCHKIEEVIRELERIETKHKINGIGKCIHFDSEQLLKVDHDIIKIAKEIKEKEVEDD